MDPSPQPPSPTPANFDWRRWLAGWRLYAILGGLILVMAVILTVVTRPSSGPTNTTNPETNQSVNQSAPTSGRPTFRRLPTDVTQDQDRDGLTDAEELTAGTDRALADTDGDELTDADEVKIYQTDPLKQDTDGDNFPDGLEVKTGNNPKGPGRLLDLPQAIQQLTNTTSEAQ